MANNQLNCPKNLFSSGHKKGIYFQTPKEQALVAFSNKPQTMQIAARQTGIERAKIWRLICKWHKRGRLHLLHQGLWNASKLSAGYYTPDTNLIIQPFTLF
jgi:hypothetical protein